MTAATPMMEAWTYRRYGGPEVLTRSALARPVPAAGEVLVRVRATTVTAADWRARTLAMPPGFGALGRLVFGITRPRKPVLGTELAGTIAAVGPGVTGWRVGDAVFAFPGGRLGAHAEYRLMPADGRIAAKPAALGFAEAAALSFGGTTALHFLRKAGVKPGDRILVIGASGNVGTALIQLARHFGAEVTAVTSGGNRDLVLGLGAAQAVDYTREPMLPAGQRFDIIADAVGATSMAKARDALADGGRFLAIAGSLGQLVTAGRPWGRGRKVIAGPAPERPEDIRQLGELAAAGVFRAVIDRTYSFADLPAAHEYVATGRKRGSVVVTVGE